MAGLKRPGKKKWRHYVADVVKRLKAALQADYVVLGGGNAGLLKTLPAKARLGGTPTRSSLDLEFGRTEASLPAAVSVPATSTRPREAVGLLDPFSFFPSNL